MYGTDIDEALDVVDPVVSSFPKNRSQARECGAAHAVKAINNILLATNLISITEGVLALKILELSPKTP